MKSKAKMVVVHLTNTIRRGGAERQLANICMNSTNIDNIVVSLHDNAHNYLLEYNKYIPMQSKSFIGRLWEFSRLLRICRPDIVYTWSSLAYLIAVTNSMFQRFKVINGSIRHGVFINSLSGHYRRMLLHCSRYVIANSKSGLKVNKVNKGFVIYNGVDERFDASKYNLIRSEIAMVTLSSIANLVPVKDYRTIFNALASLKSEGVHCIYYVMGDGPLRSEYESLVVKLGIQDRVYFLGSIPNPEEYLAKTDIFIHSSRGEGCPNAVLEAMFMGLPIIATDTGGTSEVLDDNAVLFPLGDDIKLTAAIKLLANSKELRDRMGKKSHQIVLKHFSVNMMVTNFERIIKAIYVNDFEYLKLHRVTKHG